RPNSVRPSKRPSAKLSSGNANVSNASNSANVSVSVKRSPHLLVPPALITPKTPVTWMMQTLNMMSNLCSITSVNLIPTSRNPQSNITMNNNTYIFTPVGQTPVQRVFFRIINSLFYFDGD